MSTRSNCMQMQAAALWPLYRHTLASVRLHTVRCCVALLRTVATTNSGVLDSAKFLQPMLRLAFERLLADSSTDVCAACAELLHCLAQECPAAALAQSLDAHTLQILAALPCMPAMAPLPTSYLWQGSNPHGSAAHDIPSLRIAADAGGDAVASRRVLCAQSLANLASNLHVAASDEAVQLTMTNLQNLLGTYVLGQGAEAVAFGAMVLFFWLIRVPAPSETLPHSICEQVRRRHCNVNAVRCLASG